MSPTTDGKNVSIKMNEEFISRLDYLAHKAKLSRHQLLRNLLEVGIEELEDLKNIGMFQLGILARDVATWCNLPKSDPVTGEKAIPVTLDEKLLTRLDALAERADLSRAMLMRNLVRVGVEGLETMDKVGLVKLFTIVRDLPEYFRAVCEDGEQAANSLKR